jgi:hypothetical protein
LHLHRHFLHIYFASRLRRRKEIDGFLVAGPISIVERLKSGAYQGKESGWICANFDIASLWPTS